MTQACKAQNYGHNFVLTFITNQPHLAKIADASGVQRIGIDLEYLNKAPRQSGHATRLSQHSVTDLKELAEVVDPSKLFVRINALHAHSEQEIEAVLAAGARYVMLPYFHRAAEVAQFVRLLNERAKPVALVETAAAVARIRDILAVDGLSEVMLGLNDLRLSFGMQHHFEILSSPLMDMIAAEIAKTNLLFTLGGVASPHQKSLPMDPDWVLAQYPRLGAHGAWLARSAFEASITADAFANTVNTIRDRLSEHAQLSRSALVHYRHLLEEKSRLLGSL
ncbi:MAG: aldolase/citrate lyase family protein [Burkholderiaceae bacterium]